MKICETCRKDYSPVKSYQKYCTTSCGYNHPKHRTKRNIRRRELSYLRGRSPKDYLDGSQIEQIIAAIKTGRLYASIAVDWLISASHVAYIARQHGIRRGRPIDQSYLLRRINRNSNNNT